MTLTITDDKGTTWSSRAAAQDANNNASAETFYALNLASETQFITATPSAAVSYVQFMGFEWQNVATASTGPIGKAISPTDFTIGLKTASANALCILTNARVAVRGELWYPEI